MTRKLTAIRTLSHRMIRSPAHKMYASIHSKLFLAHKMPEAVTQCRMWISTICHFTEQTKKI